MTERSGYVPATRSWFHGANDPALLELASSRRANRLHILDAVRHHGPISRAELAKRSRLSAPTVSAVVDDLTASKGLLREIGMGASSGGRRPILVEFNAEYGYVAGIDLGSRTVRFGLTDLQGRLLARHNEPTRATSRGATIEQIGNGIDTLLAIAGLGRDKLFALGIGAPGMTDVRAGRVIGALNIEGFTDVPLRDILQERFQVPVAVDNDANMAALGERWMGCARNQRDFVFVAWGAGIGAGLVVGGRLHHGHQWFAGEIGHLHLDYREWNSDFGDRGYLETRVGASGIARLVDPGSDPARLFAAAAAGEPQARRVVEEVTVYLGMAVANLATILDPALVVFGGGLSNAGPPLLDSIRQVVLRMVPNVPEIRLSALGEEAQLYGSLFSALQLAERRLCQIAVGQPSAAQGATPAREADIAVV